MSDEREISPRAVKAVELAIGAAGEAKDPGVWYSKVASLTPQIAAMLRPSSTLLRHAQEVIDSDVFRAVYKGYTVEASSKRCVVTLGPPPGKEADDETIRTARTDEPGGRRMKRLLDSIAPGAELLVYKAMEEMSGQTGRKVRILVHFDVLEAASSAGAAQPPVPPADPAPPRDAPRGGADLPPDPGKGNETKPSSSKHEELAESAIDEALADVPAALKVRIVQRLRKEVGDSWHSPSVDEIDKVLLIIRDMKAGGA